jgi:hypothetical protein
MNISRIYALFTLFSGETDIKQFEPLIWAAVKDVEMGLKADADINDDRLCFLAAAAANVTYARVIAARNDYGRTFGGVIPQYAGNASELADSLFKSYKIHAQDLLKDENFMFSSVRG